jgi:hypothetical protein
MAHQSDTTTKAQTRARGTGTVYLDKARDRWIGAVTIDGRRHKVTAKKRIDAEAELNRLVARYQLGVQPENSSITVSEF